MFNPQAFTVEDAEDILAMLRAASLGHFVTTTEGHEGAQLTSTALPFVIDDELVTVRAHFARANPHWKTIDGCTALLIVPGPGGYVSPNWYPSKAEHHRVVPTWNYELVHLRGVLRVHDDPAWKRQLVSDLTDEHEQRLSTETGGEPWEVDDAPSDFIDGQLRAIVGVELEITAIEAKRKLSQNKPEADRAGALEGLAARWGRSGVADDRT